MVDIKFKIAFWINSDASLEISWTNGYLFDSFISHMVLAAIESNVICDYMRAYVAFIKCQILKAHHEPEIEKNDEKKSINISLTRINAFLLSSVVFLDFSSQSHLRAGIFFDNIS